LDDVARLFAAKRRLVKAAKRLLTSCMVAHQPACPLKPTGDV
jgi:hypothetical protein